LAGDVFEQLQLEDYLPHLRAQEAAMWNRPHPYEMALYFEA
jgi:hypothetical protein